MFDSTFNPNERSYACFVCAIPFKTLEEYKEHIFTSHEEGREWVKCPLSRCGFPVRDMRSHFKVYHKTEPIPKNCQLKALIWTDVKTKRRRKKTSFKEGYYISTKNKGASLHYRSGYEKEVYECLEELNEVLSYKVEPFGVEYYLNGEKRTYFPDLLIQFADHYEVWEIKPNNQTRYAMNQAKWGACNEYCKVRNWHFMVLNEYGIDTLKKMIQKRKAVANLTSAIFQEKNQETE
jgi:hypothetical protein